MKSRPLTTYRIAFENIRRKPFRTFGQIFIVAMFAFVLFSGSVLSGSIKSGMESMSKRLGADLMIIPYGYEKQLQSPCYAVNPVHFIWISNWKRKYGLFLVSGMFHHRFLSHLFRPPVVRFLSSLSVLSRNPIL